MEIKSRFDHFNINVTNLERSIAFYEKALGLKEHSRKEASIQLKQCKHSKERL